MRNTIETTVKRQRHYRLSTMFHLRYSKKFKEIGTVYTRVTIDGHRGPEWSLNIKVSKDDWDFSKQNVRPNNRNFQAYNTKINELIADINESYNEVKRSGKPVTAKRIVSFVRTRKIDLPTLDRVYNEFVKEKKSTSVVCDGTIEGYEKRYKNIVKYYESKRTKVILLDNIDRYDLIDLLAYLKKSFSNDYSVKIGQLFKSLMSYAHSKKLVEFYPFEGIVMERNDHYDTTHINQNEVRQMFDFDFSTLQIPAITAKCLSEERDMFVWTCYTGQHHGDYIKKSYEVFEYNGKMWLGGFRVKSEGGRKNKRYQMPLHPIALQILERYGSIEKLPVRNNTKRNTNLKVIGAYIGINQNLTTKVARKTLANYCLNELSMRAETVAAVLGHSSTKHLKHYAKISNESICREMTFSDLTNEVQPLKQA